MKLASRRRRQLSSPRCGPTRCPWFSTISLSCGRSTRRPTASSRRWPGSTARRCGNSSAGDLSAWRTSPLRTGNEPIPYQFFQAQSALGQHADRAVDIARGWYSAGDPSFQFRGGRLVAIAFPDCPPALCDKLAAVIAGRRRGSPCLRPRYPVPLPRQSRHSSYLPRYGRLPAGE